MLVACFSPGSAVKFLMGSVALPPVDVKRRASVVTADLILVVLLWVALVAAESKRSYDINFNDNKEKSFNSQCHPGFLRRLQTVLGMSQFAALAVETEAKFVRGAAPLLWVEAVSRVVLVVAAVVEMSG